MSEQFVWRDMALDQTDGGGLRRYMLSVYRHMGLGLAVTGATALLAIQSGFYAVIAHSAWLWLVLLAPLALALVFSFGFQRLSLGATRALFWVYAVAMGLSLAGVFLVYTATSITRVFFIAAAMFLAMSLWGYTTGRDLTRLGAFMMMGLVGILIAGVVNLFLGSTGLQFALSVGGVIVFTGLTAWDTQRIKELYWHWAASTAREKLALMGALALYLDFINLFLALLQLMGDRRDR
ncbi:MULTISPECIES: Bax inhibitor-1/YccA family protein [Nitrospirillum]|uniref:BAX inhibitor (BI)-1/YccA family protein n=2 Tax=Nitrospirillum TaxID=1543705 RepID=A0A248K0Z8_9PROT|nr:Bax inhibitor-1/YccA family protein [Nitrospirillum amazonense]ASG24490.1 hypothetical protein Y958_26830 [Nitrospirillum amazonense CBAmc]TWB37166.1 hypothetical protein FBZ91_108238 [Nitrospirillum amazonense]TWB47675.1 hypothetical protein FBZ92_13348 [Nitrospirillum amazonense]TWB65942.1 hypothetical protein FBZ87_11737 [Nitrospirillum amazonense]